MAGLPFPYKTDGAESRWKILLVEDDEEDYLLTRDILSDVRNSRYTLDWASSYEEGKRSILSDGYDAILMDYELGFLTGLDLIREVSGQGIRAPFILLTGRGNYEIDVEAMNVGVNDYLAKSEATPVSMERTIRYAILQKQTEEALRKAKDELESRVQERTREISNKNAELEAEITERKRIEAELEEVQRRLIDHTEAERVELARDIHDGPMQELYGLVFQMETLAGDFVIGHGEQAVTSMKEKLLSVVQSLRTISRELRPPALAPYGLEKAIRSHAEYLQQAHPDLRISLRLDRDGQQLPESVRMALFRIYQTTITNVIRHAQASRAEVTFQLQAELAELEIKDNGCGFAVPRRWIELARRGHMGLVGAAERAEAAGGKLDVESAPGKGTIIRVRVPRSSK